MAKNDDGFGCVAPVIILLWLLGAFIEWLGRVLGAAWTATASFFSNLWISISGALPLIGQIIGVVAVLFIGSWLLIRAVEALGRYRKERVHRRSLLGRIEIKQKNVGVEVTRIDMEVESLSKNINAGGTFVSGMSSRLAHRKHHPQDGVFINAEVDKERALIRSWTNSKNTLLLKKHHLEKTLNGLDSRYKIVEYRSKRKNAEDEIERIRAYIEHVGWLIKYDFSEWWDIDMDLQGDDLSYYEELSLEDLRKAVTRLKPPSDRGTGFFTGFGQA